MPMDVVGKMWLYWRKNASKVQLPRVEWWVWANTRSQRYRGDPTLPTQALCAAGSLV